MKKINIWYLSSFLISFVVLIPIATISFSFFDETTEYSKILKETFLLEYIYNSAVLLFGVLILTSLEQAQLILFLFMFFQEVIFLNGL